MLKNVKRASVVANFLLVSAVLFMASAKSLAQQQTNDETDSSERSFFMKFVRRSSVIAPYVAVFTTSDGRYRIVKAGPSEDIEDMEYWDIGAGDIDALRSRLEVAVVGERRFFVVADKNTPVTAFFDVVAAFGTLGIYKHNVVVVAR